MARWVQPSFAKSRSPAPVPEDQPRQMRGPQPEWTLLPTQPQTLSGSRHLGLKHWQFQVTVPWA